MIIIREKLSSLIRNFRIHRRFMLFFFGRTARLRAIHKFTYLINADAADSENIFPQRDKTVAHPRENADFRTVTILTCNQYYYGTLELTL